MTLPTIADFPAIQKINPNERHDNPVLEVGEAYAWVPAIRTPSSALRHESIQGLVARGAEVVRIVVTRTEDNEPHDGQRAYYFDAAHERARAGGYIRAYEVIAKWDDYAEASGSGERIAAVQTERDAQHAQAIALLPLVTDELTRRLPGFEWSRHDPLRKFECGADGEWGLTPSGTLAFTVQEVAAILGIERDD